MLTSPLPGRRSTFASGGRQMLLSLTTGGAMSLNQISIGARIAALAALLLFITLLAGGWAG